MKKSGGVPGVKAEKRRHQLPTPLKLTECSTLTLFEPRSDPIVENVTLEQVLLLGSNNSSITLIRLHSDGLVCSSAYLPRQRPRLTLGMIASGVTE